MGKNLKNTILTKIENDKIKPISKKNFIWKNRIVWLILILIVIIIGILLSFSINDLFELIDFSFFRINPILFLPSLFWLFTVILLIPFGIIGFRKTRNGYKIQISLILILLIIFSLSISIFLLNKQEIKNIHKTLIENIPGIKKYIYNEDIWNTPEKGRLLGIIIKIENSKIIIKDIKGKKWNISTNLYTHIGKYVKLNENSKIRIIGNKISESEFEATKIIPYFGEGKNK